MTYQPTHSSHRSVNSSFDPAIYGTVYRTNKKLSKRDSVFNLCCYLAKLHHH